MRGIIDELKEIRTYNDIQLFNRVTDNFLDKPHCKDDLLKEMDFLNTLLSSGTQSQPVKDVNYYHRKIPFIEIKKSTDKSHLMSFKGKTDEIVVWVPKKICRIVDTKRNYIFVHTPIFSDILMKEVDRLNTLKTIE